jgi:hypothetical protein
MRDRGLTLLLLSMFAVSLAGQVVTGRAEYNEEREAHGRPRVTLTAYLSTGHPWEALFENWESEFLQMAVFVLLTTFLIQKGSPESRRPGVTELVDADPRDFGDAPEAPWPVRRGAGSSRSMSIRSDLPLSCCSSSHGPGMRWADSRSMRPTNNSTNNLRLH